MSFVKIGGSHVGVSNIKATGRSIQFDVEPSDGDLFEEQPVFEFFDDADVAVGYVVAGFFCDFRLLTRVNI
jgi:hypothetical protein